MTEFTLTSPEVAEIPPVIREVYCEVMEEMSRPRVITVTGLPGGLPAVIEDRSLPHQIVLLFTGHGTGVSCNCLGTRSGRGRGLIEVRPAFPAQAAIKAYQRWHQARGIEVRMA